jgi:protease I
MSSSGVRSGQRTSRARGIDRAWEAVESAGGLAEILAPSLWETQAMNHLDKGDRLPVDGTTGEVSVEDLDVVVLAGGVANPDRLRTDAAAVEFLRAMFRSGKPAAVIRHGPWTLVEGDLVRDRTLRSWPSLHRHRERRGTRVNQEVQLCSNGLNVPVMNRKPDALKAFCEQMARDFWASDKPDRR